MVWVHCRFFSVENTTVLHNPQFIESVDKQPGYRGLTFFFFLKEVFFLLKRVILFTYI